MSTIKSGGTYTDLLNSFSVEWVTVMDVYNLNSVIYTTEKRFRTEMVCQPKSSTYNFHDMFFDIYIKVTYFTKYITAGLFIFFRKHCVYYIDIIIIVYILFL